MTALRFGRREPVIGIDASRIGVTHRTGTETYTWETLKAMADLAPDAPVRLYFNGSSNLFPYAPAWQKRSIPFPKLWTHLRLSAEMAQHPPSLLWVPAHVIPINHPKSVVTVHDLGYLHRPEGHTDRQRRMLDWTTRWSCHAASAIIAISESTRMDLIERYGVSPEKISVIPHGVGAQYVRANDASVADIRRRYSLERPFVLAVGTLQPRKNYDGLARSLKRVEPELGDIELVIAGKSGWMADDVRAAIDQSGFAAKVKLLDYVPDADLPALYSAAEVVAFLSWYEGFGLPALEAMSCGTPVVASNRGSLPEVVGPGGDIVDPEDESAMGAAIVRVVTDSFHRADLVERGQEQAARYSWRQTARATLDLLTKQADIPG